MALSKILENSITDGVVSAAKLKDFAAAVDLNGVELILDADQDTSITADTDDRIDFKIAGVEHISISNSSGDTVIKPMVDAKDIVFQQYDGNKIFEINDANFVAVSGAAAGPGEIRIYEDTDNGTHYTGFKAGNNTASVAYVLPTADGTSGFQLTTDGSGTLSWSSAGTTLANDANNRVVTGTGSGLNGEANLTFDGSTLAVTGAITGSSDLTLQDDLILDSDAAVLSFGEDNEITLTHVADTGLLLNGASVIQFRDSAINIGSPADGDLDINADDEVEINSTLIDVNGNLDVSGTIVGASTLSATTITASTAFVPDASDGAALGTTALEFSDLFLADASTIQFGADQDVILTHVADTGLLLSGTNVIQFNDASQNIGAPSATVLDINATDEIELNATLIDVNGNLDVSGTIVGASTLSATTGTFSGILKTDDATDATSTTDGSLQTDGGLSVAKDTIIGNDLKLLSDSAVLVFGAGSDATLTHTNDTGLTLNSTNKLMFNDASQFIQGSSGTVLSIGATDEIDLTATTVDLNGTLNVSGVATFQAAPVFPDGSLAVADLDIDGATDIGAAIVDADLFIVDDGAGGTNRKTTAARIKTYIGSGVTFKEGGTDFSSGLIIGNDSTGTLSAANDNTGMGANVFSNLTSGDRNTALGKDAFEEITSGSDNIAIGAFALKPTTIGTENIAVGSYALDAQIDGDKCVAIGHGALGKATNNQCVAVGDRALDNVTSGANNIALGSESGAKSNWLNWTTESNRLTLGNYDITHSYVKVDWTVGSDIRDKTNFGTVPHGIDFVKQLNPISYKFRTARDEDTTTGGVKYGFSAQDILALEKANGGTNVIVDDEFEEHLNFTNSHLTPVLVKALKEAITKIETLETKVQALEDA